jgi:uncharacterized membrane protein YdbT with pleckstrin-like domain
MSYVQSHLQEGETVVHQTTVHWIVYGRAVFWLVVAAVLYVASMRALDADYVKPLHLAALAAVVLAVLDALRALMRRMSTELAVTSLRVISKTGIIRRRTFEMNRSKIESVLVDQSILGRLFDFGTIIIKGTGGGIDPLVGIDQPMKFRSFVTAG